MPRVAGLVILSLMVGVRAPAMPTHLPYLHPTQHCTPTYLQLYKDLIAGTLKGAFNEFDICIERGFADRTFEPLVAAASAAPAVAV